MSCTVKCPFLQYKNVPNGQDIYKPVNVSALEDAVTVWGTVKKLSSIDEPEDPRRIVLLWWGLNADAADNRRGLTEHATISGSWWSCSNVRTSGNCGFVDRCTNWGLDWPMIFGSRLAMMATLGGWTSSSSSSVPSSAFSRMVTDSFLHCADAETIELDLK